MLQTAPILRYQSSLQDWTPLAILPELQRHIRHKPLQAAMASSCQSFLQIGTPSESASGFRRLLRHQLRLHCMHQPLRAGMTSSCQAFLQIWIPSQSLSGLQCQSRRQLRLRLTRQHLQAALEAQIGSLPGWHCQHRRLLRQHSAQRHRLSAAVRFCKTSLGCWILSATPLEPESQLRHQPQLQHLPMISPLCPALPRRCGSHSIAPQHMRLERLMRMHLDQSTTIAILQGMILIRRIAERHLRTLHAMRSIMLSLQLMEGRPFPKKP